MSARITRSCPVGFRCESCGDDHPDVAAHIRQLGAAGEACLTLCPTCTAWTDKVPVTEGTAVRLVDQHAQHVKQAAVLDSIPTVTPGRSQPMMVPHVARKRAS